MALDVPVVTAGGDPRRFLAAWLRDVKAVAGKVVAAGAPNQLECDAAAVFLFRD